MRRWCHQLFVLTVFLVPVPVVALSPDDVSGSRDPDGLQRFPRSHIVAYRQDDEVRPHDFVMSRVDRIRRELRVADQLRLDATLEAVTYEIPEDVSVDAVVAHFDAELGDDVLFRCRGRDCGRSNDWANQIFGQAILYGPDRGQRYVAREWQGKLVALYVVERGNRRVYAHVRILDPQGAIGIEPNTLVGRRLAERGWAVIEGVTPATDGGFDPAAETLLGDLAAQLGSFAGETVLVVCHLYGAGAPPPLIEASSRCAATAAELISNGAGDGARVGLVPFGAGPAAPRGAVARPRLELVAPVALKRAP